jgi:glycosyltransferase involved in cell wall biosynthesis
MISPQCFLSIGYLSPGWPLDAFPNGVVSYITDMADQLRRMGHQVTIAASSVMGSHSDPGIYNIQQACSSRTFAQRVTDGLAYRIAPHHTAVQLFRRALLATARRAIAERGIQLFEMEESFGWASAVRRATSIPICIRLHGPWFLNGPALGAALDRAFHRRVQEEGRAIAEADAVTSSSLDTLEQTRAFYNLRLPDAEVVHPPTPVVLPTERWCIERCNATEALFIGRFDRHKGGDLIIEAFGHVLREVPQAKLRFVGPDCGYIDSGGQHWNVDQFVRDRLPGTLESGRVELLGPQPFSALADLRRKAMVTVICSRYENAPRALIEAMSLGCPIVASRVGGIPEILRDQVDGLLHRPEDPHDLAAQITSLFNAPARAAQLGQQAAMRCEQHFHPEVTAARMVDFYRRALIRCKTDMRRHKSAS